MSKKLDKALSKMPDPSNKIYYHFWAEKYDDRTSRDLLLLFLEKKGLVNKCDKWLRKNNYIEDRD